MLTHQAHFVREDHRMHPVTQIELGQNITDVSLHGNLRHHKFVRDLGIGKPGCHGQQHLSLTRGQRCEGGIRGHALAIDRRQARNADVEQRPSNAR